jgi:hypothetical protein
MNVNGTPILTDWWEGLWLVARSGAEVMEIFSLSDNDLNKIGMAAGQRALVEHTSAVRAAQLEHSATVRRLHKELSP